MNEKQLNRMKNDKGFIAALDQSGGSTPRALENYGIGADQYSSEEQMFDLVQEMRARIIMSPAFSKDQILGAILFEQTMDRKIDGKYSGDYLWEEKGIVPFLKTDKGLADESNSVQLMKDMPQLDALLDRAVERNIFGTKMRSVIHEANKEGIQAIVDQQFAIGKQIAAKGLVPILEPEVNIKSETKEEAEEMLHAAILEGLKDWDDKPIMFKVSIPTKVNLYRDIMDDPRVVRVVALSGGYSLEEANELLAKNEGLIASFSRALLADLNANQTADDFNQALSTVSKSIYEASL